MKACEKMTILYSCNQNYIKQTLISISSVMEYHSVPIEFILVSDKLSSADERQVRELVENTGNQLCLIDLNTIPEIKEMETDGVHPRGIYAKLFPDRLTDADRILYLDSDVVANASFMELFSMDLGENVVAGVRMPYSSSILKKQGIQSEVYICDGIVLFDVKKWRQKNLSQRAVRYIDKYNGAPAMMSESVINYVCAGEIFILPPKYNLMPQFIVFTAAKLKEMYCLKEYYFSSEIEEAKHTPVFIHYMNELYNRPWCRKSKNAMWEHPYRNIYEKYQTELGISQEAPPSLTVKTKITRYLFCGLPFSVFALLFHKIHKN